MQLSNSSSTLLNEIFTQRVEENLQYKEEDNNYEVTGGTTYFSTTRRIVRAICFERIIDNYDAIIKLWDQCLNQRYKDELLDFVLK